MDFEKKPGSRDKKPEKGTRRYGGHEHERKQHTLFCFDCKGEITESYYLNKVAYRPINLFCIMYLLFFLPEQKLGAGREKQQL
jgi:hypothetical protein